MMNTENTEIENIFENYIKLRSKLNNAKIYKIVDNTNQNVYIGSTCNTLKNRLARHKSGYKRFLKGLFPIVKSFDILKNNNYKIELLENCNIKTKDELLEREKYYIQNNNCLNKCIPGRTKKQYYNDNKDKLNKLQKDYNESNKDKLQQKFICQCGGNYAYANKSIHIKSNKHQNYLQSLK